MRRIRSLTQTTCTGLAIVFVAVVLRHGVEATSTLDWPHDPDHLRDIAHAQNIAEGRLLDDPYLRRRVGLVQPAGSRDHGRGCHPHRAARAGRPCPLLCVSQRHGSTGVFSAARRHRRSTGRRHRSVALSVRGRGRDLDVGHLFSAPLRGQLCAGAVLSDAGRLVGWCQNTLGPVAGGNRRAVGGDRAGPHHAGRPRRRRDRHRRPVARVAVPAVRAFT